MHIFRRCMAAAAVASAMMGMAGDATAAKLSTKYLDGLGYVITVDGEIKEGDAAVFGKLVRRQQSKNEPVRTVILNSPGGSVGDAMSIAQIMRDDDGMGALVNDGKTCASACFLIFAAAKERLASPGSTLAVHRARDSMGDSDIAKAGSVELLEAYKTLDVPDNIRLRMIETPPDQVYELSAADKEKMNTPGFWEDDEEAEIEVAKKSSGKSSDQGPGMELAATPYDGVSEVAEAFAAGSAVPGIIPDDGISLAAGHGGAKIATGKTKTKIKTKTRTPDAATAKDLPPAPDMPDISVAASSESKGASKPLSREAAGQVPHDGSSVGFDSEEIGSREIVRSGHSEDFSDDDPSSWAAADVSSASSEPAGDVVKVKRERKHFMSPSEDRAMSKSINLLRIGTNLLRQGKTRDAISALSRARNFAPDDHVIMAKLGYAYLIASSYQNAEHWLNESLKIDSNRAETWRTLGMVYAGRAQRQQATDCFIRYFNLSDNREHAASVLAKLEADFVGTDVEIAAGEALNKLGIFETIVED